MQRIRRQSLSMGSLLFLSISTNISGQLRNVPTQASKPSVRNLVLEADKYIVGNGVPIDETRAARLYFQAATAGDAEGETRYAECLFDGRGLVRNHPEARVWLQKAIDQNYARALTDMGDILASGYDGPPNRAAAVALFAKAAAHDPVAETYLGEADFAGWGLDNTKQSALEHHRSASSHGSLSSFLDIGLIFEKGSGVTVDLKSACDAYSSAVALESKGTSDQWSTLRPIARSFVIAALRLADLSGKGCDSSKYPSAVELRTRANLVITKGQSRSWMGAYTEAGLVYEGFGGPVDYSKATDSFAKGAQLGDRISALQMGLLYMSPGFPNHSVTAAIDWLQKSAALNDATAALNLGKIYMGWLIDAPDFKDVAAAAKWFGTSADLGDPEGQYQLANLVVAAVGVPKDLEKAFILYQRAANSGFSLAQTATAFSLQTGRGVNQDYASAAAWYRKAAEQGDRLAQNNLAALYERGWGVQQSDREAILWYRKALENDKAATQRLVTSAQIQGNLDRLLARQASSAPSVADATDRSPKKTRQGQSARKPTVYVVVGNNIGYQPLPVIFGVCDKYDCPFSTMVDITTDTAPPAHLPNGAISPVPGLTTKVVLCPEGKYVGIISDRRYPNNGDYVDCNVPELPDALMNASSVIYELDLFSRMRTIRLNGAGDSAPQ